MTSKTLSGVIFFICSIYKVYICSRYYKPDFNFSLINLQPFNIIKYNNMKENFSNIELEDNKISISYYSGKSQIYDITNIKSICLKYNRKKWYNNYAFFAFLALINLVNFILNFNLLFTISLISVSVLFVFVISKISKKYMLIINFKLEESLRIKVKEELKYNTIDTINKIKNKLWSC